MPKVLSLIVAVLCAFTLAASCFLGLSYLVVKGASPAGPLLVLAAFMLQSSTTLVVLAIGRGPAGVVALVAGGAVGLTWLGGSVLTSTLSGPHFEGYALIMGVTVILQGLSTLALGIGKRPEQQ